MTKQFIDILIGKQEYSLCTFDLSKIYYIRKKKKPAIPKY